MKHCRHCGKDRDESDFWPSRPSKCKDCDRRWKAEYRARNREMLAEYWREYRKNNPERVSVIQKRHYGTNKDRWTRKQATRVARKQAVTSTPYDREEIFRRDEFVCHVCRESIDMTLKFPDRWSASLDHRIPLCFGGEDTADNVFAAHLICNLRKGASVDAGSA